MELPGGIHERIGDLRTAAGISQKDLSKALGIQPSVLSRIERGETKAISHELVIKIANYFHVSTDFLLGVSDIRFQKNIDLQKLGLSNKALLLLLQHKVNGDMLSRLIEHPYFPLMIDTANAYFTEAHTAGFQTRNDLIDIATADISDFMKEHPEKRAEMLYDKRALNAQKITGTEADLEKIRSLFFHILKDIKNEFNQPVIDIESQKISEQISAMKQQAFEQKQEKPDFSEMDKVQIMSGMLSGADLDEYEIMLFQQLALHILQRKSQEILSSDEE